MGKEGLKSGIIVLVVASIFRLMWLTDFPPHLRNDEASLEYNAYSITKTLKDEHGHTLPILFKSFGDWKPGLYIYLTMPFVLLLGPTDLAVRLPGAISGVIAVYLIYHLVFELFSDRKLAMYSALLLALAPWHIAFSRGAWEAQVTVTLTVAAVTCFLRGLKGNDKLLLLSAFLFGCTFLMSHSAKAATPIVVLSLLVVYGRRIIKVKRKTLFLSVLIIALFVLPVVLSFVSGKSTRVEFLFEDSIEFTRLVEKWLEHFSLERMFLTGDGNPQHGGYGFGALMVMDVILFFVGVVVFLRRESGYLPFLFLLLWLVLSPLSSVFTHEGINYVRYMNVFVPVTVVLAMGFRFLRNKKFFWVFAFLYLANFVFFLDAYLVHSSKKSVAWQYGYKQIVNYISPIQNDYQKVYVAQSSDQPYIYFLLYQKYPPAKYQEVSLSVFDPTPLDSGMGRVVLLDNIEFVDLEKTEFPVDKTFLVVVPSKVDYLIDKYKLERLFTVEDALGFPLYEIVSNKI